MQVKKIVAGTVMGVGMGAMALAGGGTASAENSNWHPGDGKWQPGAAIATFSSNIKVANGNFSGSFNGVKVLSGNKVVVNALNGNKFLNGNKILSGNFNGAFSNNILNTGANSFNQDNSKSYVSTVVKNWTKTINSYNTTTTTTTEGDSCQGNCGENQGPD